MAEKHNAREVLAIARDLVFKLQALIENKWYTRTCMVAANSWTCLYMDGLRCLWLCSVWAGSWLPLMRPNSNLIGKQQNCYGPGVYWYIVIRSRMMVILWTALVCVDHLGYSLYFNLRYTLKILPTLNLEYTLAIPQIREANFMGLNPLIYPPILNEYQDNIVFLHLD